MRDLVNQLQVLQSAFAPSSKSPIKRGIAACCFALAVLLQMHGLRSSRASDPAALLLGECIHYRVGPFSSEARLGRFCALQVLEGARVGLSQHAGGQHPECRHLLLTLLGCGLSSQGTCLCTALALPQTLHIHPQCRHLRHTTSRGARPVYSGDRQSSLGIDRKQLDVRSGIEDAYNYCSEQVRGISKGCRCRCTQDMRLQEQVQAALTWWQCLLFQEQDNSNACSGVTWTVVLLAHS